MTERLFRSEAYSVLNRRLLGSVSLAVNPPLVWVTAIAGALFLLLALLITFLNIDERVVSAGVIKPDQGLIRLPAEHDVVVVERPIAEGAKVAAGDPLLTVRIGGRASSEDSFADILSSQQRKAANASEQLALSRSLSRQTETQTLRQIGAIETEQRNLEDLQTIQEERVATTQAALDEVERLIESKFISTNDVNRRKADHLDAQAELARTRREIIQLAAELSAAKTELATGRAARRIDTIQAEQQSNDIAIDATTLASSLITLEAPVDGTVVALFPRLGEAVSAGNTLVSLVPSSANMQAEIYVLAGSIGRVRLGQTVKIEYEAYPRTRFGYDNAVVTSISRDVLQPHELPDGMAQSQPVYRVIAELSPRDSTTAARFALQPSMPFRAEILIGEQPAWRVLLGPLFSRFE